MAASIKLRELQRRRWGISLLLALRHVAALVVTAGRALLPAAVASLFTAGGSWAFTAGGSWAFSAGGSWARKVGALCEAAPSRQTSEHAFVAGCRAFAASGYRFGDPADYLHAADHPHISRPDFLHCNGCTPPVHGSVLLMYRTDGGELRELRGEDVLRSRPPGGQPGVWLRLKSKSTAAGLYKAMAPANMPRPTLGDRAASLAALKAGRHSV